MGCASSKQNRCSHCNTPYSPVPRSYTMHVHHPPQSKGDSYHVVALTSTTLGSLDQLSSKISGNGFRFSSNGKVSDSDNDRFMFGNNGNSAQNNQEKSDVCSKEFSNGFVEAKNWSDMIEHKLPKAMPKTPISTPPCEPETINTWELMEGLEDLSPLRSPNHFRSISFDVNLNGHVDPPKSCFIENNNDSASPKPVWLQMKQEEEPNLKPDGISDFEDPKVVSSFKKSLQEKQESMAGNNGFSFDEKKISGGGGDDVVMDFEPTPYGKKDKVVFFFTSLRGVRKTYEDCCNARLILKGLGVRVDERDVSMHSGFKEELKELLGNNGFGKGRLPRVFVGRNYVGGAEEIQRLHEDGKLEKLLECCEKIDGSGGGEGVCEACGDIRFVPCETCFGSCKIYYEGGDDDEDEEEQEDCEDSDEYGFQRCPDCNENGLIRCPICCY